MVTVTVRSPYRSSHMYVRFFPSKLRQHRIHSQPYSPSPHYLPFLPPPLQTTQACVVNVDSNNTVTIIAQSHRRSRRSHFSYVVVATSY